MSSKSLQSGDITSLVKSAKEEIRHADEINEQINNTQGEKTKVSSAMTTDKPTVADQFLELFTTQPVSSSIEGQKKVIPENSRSKQPVSPASSVSALTRSAIRAIAITSINRLNSSAISAMLAKAGDPLLKPDVVHDFVERYNGSISGYDYLIAWHRKLVHAWKTVFKMCKFKDINEYQRGQEVQFQVHLGSLWHLLFVNVDACNTTDEYFEEVKRVENESNTYLYNLSTTRGLHLPPDWMMIPFNDDIKETSKCINMLISTIFYSNTPNFFYGTGGNGEYDSVLRKFVTKILKDGKKGGNQSGNQGGKKGGNHRRNQGGKKGGKRR